MSGEILELKHTVPGDIIELLEKAGTTPPGYYRVREREAEYTGVPLEAVMQLAVGVELPSHVLVLDTPETGVCRILNEEDVQKAGIERIHLRWLGNPSPTTGELLAHYAHLIQTFGPESLHTRAFLQDPRAVRNKEFQDLAPLSLKLHHAMHGSSTAEPVRTAEEKNADFAAAYQPETFNPENELADRIATAKLKLAAEEVLLTVPEVRSVVCVVDYRGAINDAPDFRAAAWVGSGPGGVVSDPAAMIGGMYNMLRTLRHMLDRAEQYVQALEKDTVNATKQLLAAKSEQTGDAAGGPQPPAASASG